jgi:hypothetical protein
VETRIPVGVHTVDSIDLLVQAVHARVNGWGIAGDRMYWRPELVLSETPDGRGRREDLERLLADSGLDTRRKGEPNIVRPLPPVRQAAAVAPVRFTITETRRWHATGRPRSTTRGRTRFSTSSPTSSAS